MADSLYQAQSRRDDALAATARKEQTISEFQADQLAFFDKALLAALHIAPSLVNWPKMLLSDDARSDLITDTAVSIALELVMKRQVQIDNGEI